MFPTWTSLNFLLLSCLCLGALARPYKRHHRVKGDRDMDMEYAQDESPDRDKHNIRKEVETDPERTGHYYQGDMAVTFQRNGLISPTSHWPNATVYYKIANKFNITEVDHIKLAMFGIERVSCVRFMPCKRGHFDFVSIDHRKPGCFSRVGYRGGVQKLNLERSDLAPKCIAQGKIQHELLHTLGFHHQHSSPNRDLYVTIVEKNIIPGSEQNFQKYNKDQVGLFGAAYDYASLMHYHRKSFSVNKKDTIVPKLEIGKTQLGQRKGLSEADITRINEMYCK